MVFLKVVDAVMRLPFLRRQRSKLPHADSQWEQLVQLLERHAITLVVDVGANEGQYGDHLRRHGYAGRIVSFEPGAKAHDALANRAQPDPRWDIAPRMALGAAPGRAQLKTSNRSDMDSLLTATNATLEAFPKLRLTGEETVEIARLDAVMDDLVAPNAKEKLFLKIDTQGYEEHVLTGAEKVIERISGLQVEMSFLPLYEGEADYLAVLNKIHAFGFSPHILMGGFFSRSLARQLQVDGVFFR